MSTAFALVLLVAPLPLLVMVLLTALVWQGVVPAVSFLLLPPAIMGFNLTVFYRDGRRRALLPAGAAERQFWSLWLGHAVAVVLAVVVWYLLNTPERPLDPLVVYPFWVLTHGHTFFVMGGGYWGRFYLVGTVFFVLACLMPLRLAWAPLEMGLSLSLTLFLISMRLRRLAGGGRAAGAVSGGTQGGADGRATGEQRPE